MNTIFSLLFLAGALTFGSSASAAPDQDFHVYLCFGQSNMESGGKMEDMDRTVDKRFLVMADADPANRGWRTGILVHQGQSNPGDQQRADNVKGICGNLLCDLNPQTADAPLIVGELINADQSGNCAIMNRITADLLRTISTAHIVVSAGCEWREDRSHFTAAGYRELGRRYGATMFYLLGKKMIDARNPVEPPSRAYLQNDSSVRRALS